MVEYTNRRTSPPSRGFQICQFSLVILKPCFKLLRPAFFIRLVLARLVQELLLVVALVGEILLALPIFIGLANSVLLNKFKKLIDRARGWRGGLRFLRGTAEGGMGKSGGPQPASRRRGLP